MGIDPDLSILLLHDDLIENDDRSKTILFSRLFKFHALHIGPTIVVHDGTMRSMHPPMDVRPSTRMHEQYSCGLATESTDSRDRDQRFHLYRTLSIPSQIHDRCFIYFLPTILG